MTQNTIDDLLETLEQLSYRKKYNAIAYYVPYPKQAEFHEKGAMFRERLLRAGNQIGKTYAGAAETAYHLTGLYPADWKGRRFNRSVTAWVAGEGALLTREGPQRLLCGKPGVEGAIGTGLIPKHCFVDKPSMSRGVTDAFDTIQVQHHDKDGKPDGISMLSFKSYDQGRTKFQTATLDFVWCDEEPPDDIYSEVLARITNVPDGFVFITFTPLKGMSTVVSRFLQEEGMDRSDTVMTLWDVPGQTQENVDRIMRGYPSWQREARTMGVPMRGAGRVFMYPDEAIEENPIRDIPSAWRKLWGIDFGINHPFGAVLILHDLDADVIHVHKAVRLPNQLPLQHVAAMRPIAANVRVAWPQDGTARRDDGKPLSSHYQAFGLLMLPTCATWPDGSISTEAGINEISQRIETNRFKVSSLLMRGEWGDEFRNYHRDEKTLQIDKVKDDLMSATRVAVMAKRFATAVDIVGDTGIGSRKPSSPTREFADGIDFDVFA